MALLLDVTPLRASAPFRRLLWGLGISNFGTQLTVVAVGLQVYDITRSTLSVGILGICALVPLVALGLYGGALVDVYDRRKVALASSVSLWITVIALALQGWLHLDLVPLLYALVAVQSAGFAINNPARSAIVPRLVEASLLPAANVLQTITWNIALTWGPSSAPYSSRPGALPRRTPLTRCSSPPLSGRCGGSPICHHWSTRPQPHRPSGVSPRCWKGCATSPPGLMSG